MSLGVVDERKWEIVPFTNHPNHDSMWAMAVGADGHVYVGACCESIGGGIAHLYRYNVEKRALEHCADMAKVTGDGPENGHAAQGKIHFSLCPVSDGTIFGSTHSTTPPLNETIWNPYAMWGDPVRNFQGAHIFHHDPRTGRSVDFGIITPNEGIPFLLLDESRRRLYGMTYPKARFFRVNLEARDFVDYGRVSSAYSIGMCFDPSGNVFIGDTQSKLVKYDVAQDKIVFLRNHPYCSPWNRTGRSSWLTNLTLAGDGMIYGAYYSNDHFFRVDPSREEPDMEDLGPGLDDAPVRCNRAICADGPDHLYYLAYPTVDQEEAVLVRYATRARKKEVLGRLFVHGRKLWSWLSVRDRAGNLYMLGKGKPFALAIYRPAG